MGGRGREGEGRMDVCVGEKEEGLSTELVGVEAY